MRSFRTLVLTTLVLCLGAAIATSQSLAEVAKKEKQRRDKNSTASTRNITDRELASSFRGLPDSSSTVQTAPAAGAAEGTAAAGTEGQEGEGSQDETKTQAYWQNRVKGSKEKIAKLEQQLQSDDWGEGQRVGVDPMGANNLGSRQRAEQELAAARSELAAIQAEARKAGVPPGWTR
ncbi:MAG TPA: hypothetical protein VIG29_04860 [Vicinamibacteria bacterium]|jgi:hypothetical protein